jgi:capping protein alpha
LSGFYVLYVGDENEYTFHIGISAKNINLPNFYCGDWVSRWELSSTSLSGSVSLQAHYYEEGNVQLKNTNSLAAPLAINLAEPAQSAKLFIEALGGLENGHQKSMDEIYNAMPDTFFKAMRRVLPVSGTKF